MIEEYCDEQEAGIRAIEEKQLSTAEDLREIAILTVEALAAPGALQTMRMVMGEARRFPVLGRMFVEAGVYRMDNVVARHFKALNDAGKLEVPDPYLAAEMFNSMLRGSLQYRSLRALGRPPSKADTSKIVASAVEIFHRAYQPRDKSSRKAREKKN